VADDGQADPLAQLDRPVDVLLVDGILEAAGDGVLLQPAEQVDHMVVGATPGEVEVHSKSGRRHGLHRLRLMFSNGDAWYLIHVYPAAE
jgi:hypothetical protein